MGSSHKLSIVYVGRMSEDLTDFQSEMRIAGRWDACQAVRGSEYNGAKRAPQIDSRPVVVVWLCFMRKLLSSQRFTK